MADSQVTVIARFLAGDGMEGRLEQELRQMVEPTRAEPGCINYDLHRQSDDGRVFLIYENYEDAEAVEHHKQTPHFRNLQEVTPELLSEPFEVLVFEMLSAFEPGSAWDEPARKE